MKKYQVALFIGRFQPFHNGHLYSLKKALNIAERVVVGIGSSQEEGTRDNPWNASMRLEMVGRVVQEAGAQARVERVVLLPDTETDEAWAKEVVARVGEFDIVVSNNEWTLEAMRSSGYATYMPGLYRREELEGVKIRELMRQGDARWKMRVPRAVREYLEKVAQGRGE